MALTRSAYPLPDSVQLIVAVDLDETLFGQRVTASHSPRCRT